ncbi:hypothetical protein SAMN05428985_103165 [Nocardioides sp. YR527]|uniref:hypothetical protein n=1 Tax=Nocardioides sp. YR527 TaxID=1881028 RepID=UPI00088FE8BA|nr:hypothetical protein [Nocardioides sp. YR527]SDK24056.1 hypothetical protein SAMN05428985_103165 [Nocardioides sp. YR527]
MLILGLVLIVVAAALIVLGLFTTGNGDLDDPTATLLGLPVGSTTIFVIGLVAGVLLLFGVSLTKWGGKHQMKYMKDKRQMRSMAKTLQEAEAKTETTPDTTPDTKPETGPETKPLPRPEDV